MIQRLLLVVLIATSVQFVRLEPNVLSDFTAANSGYTDIQIARVDKYYILLKVGGAVRGGEYEYSFAFYELSNENRLIRRDHNFGGFSSHTDHLRMRAYPSGTTSNGIAATVVVCSSSVCPVLSVDEDNAFITDGEDWCSTKWRNDPLLSLANDNGYMMAVVRRLPDLYAFVCSPSSDRNGPREIKLQCQVPITETTEIHSVNSDLTNGNISIFILLSNGLNTSLCTISIAKDPLVNNQTMKPGNLPLSNRPTALAVAPATKGRIAFVGSTVGKIIKVYIENNVAYNIGEFPIRPALPNIFPDMFLDDDKLLLVTQDRVILVNVKQTCEQYKNLCECREPKDPKCGWCVGTNSCSTHEDCKFDNETIWIPADPSSDTICLKTEISPASVSRDNPEPLRINMERNLDTDIINNRGSAFACMFNSTNVSTKVDYSAEKSVTCNAPNSTDIDTFPAGTVTVPVVVFSLREETYLPFVVEYKLVVCSDIDNCGDCARSHDSCTWCVNDHKCTATPDSECPNSPSSSRSSFGQEDSCPRITSQSIRAPVNVEYPMSLSTANLPALPSQRIYCKVDTDDGLSVRLNAIKSGNNVTCDPHKYGDSLSSSGMFLQSSFNVSILVGEDNWAVAKAHGQVYDCSSQRVCRQCVQNVGGTGCVWCSISAQCQYQSCTPLTSAIRETCPSLDIDMVNPRSLPIEGNTTLTIQGKGFILPGRSNNVEIDLSGRQCKNVSAETTDNGNDMLKCITPFVPGSEKVSLHVVIDGISWDKPSYISYYDPSITNIGVVDNPNHRYGPAAGGTHVLISGTELSHLRTTKWSVVFTNSKHSLNPQLIGCIIVSAGLRCKTPRVNVLGEYYPQLNFTSKSYIRIIEPKRSFSYKPNSAIDRLEPRTTIVWGGNDFIVKGTHLNSVSSPMLRLQDSDKLSKCRNVMANEMTCTYPQFNTTGDTQIILVMDGIDPSLTTLNVTVLDNPSFKMFDEPRPRQKELIIDGDNIANVGISDIKVFVGEEICNITKKESTTLICTPPELSPNEKNTDVTIKIYDKHTINLGSLSYVAQKKERLSDAIIGGIAGGGSAAVIIMVIVAVLLFKRSRYHKQRYKTMVKHVDQLECNSRHEIKQAFAELQTDMSDLMSDLNVTGIPYWDYKNFTFKILFPGQTDHPSLHKLMTKRKVAVMQALDMFEHLIQNKDFLMSFIHTLESQPTFTMPDRVQLAALIMLTLQHKMDYTTIVIKELLSDLIKTSMREKHPKLLLRRSESVVEKMLTHWLSLCLYKYLQDHAGTPLFMLYKAIKHQIEKGPVDILTGEARYSLSQERLLRLTVDTTPITLNVALENGDKIQCKANDIDTITQVKEKILDVIYKNQAYSLRPLAVDYNLEWHHGMVGVPICDEDLTSQTLNGWKRLNTLAHYSIPDNAAMKLVSRHRPNSLHSDRSRDTDKLCDTLPSNRGTPRGTLTRTGALSISNLQDHYVHNHISLWHLSKSAASQTLPKDRQQTMMSEIFLTRLLKTKGTLQEFIDSLFQTIFSADNLPPTIKFLFDFLDQEAVKHGITDPEVVHIWKNNSLNLRFWVNIIKNPEFVFDIHKSEVVDASLSTIAQTFIDSCAMTESDIGADAPINKLLFARDRPRYRKMLQNMYSEIRNKPPVAEQTLNAHLSELSKMYPREVYRNSALKEIYQYAQRYQTQILQDLEDNFPKHRNPNLTSLLRDIHSTLDDRHTQLNDYV